MPERPSWPSQNPISNALNPSWALGLALEQPSFYPPSTAAPARTIPHPLHLSSSASVYHSSSVPSVDSALAAPPVPTLPLRPRYPVAMDDDFRAVIDDSASDAEMQLGADGEANLSQRRTSVGGTIYTSPSSRTRKRGLMSRSQPRPIHTPTSPMSSTIPHNLLPSAPASPPTPAPSPTPHQRAPDWSTAAEHEDTQVRDIRALFSEMNDAEKQRLLGELLNMCNSHQLSFVHDFVSPRLKKDPFQVLPNELCLRVSRTTLPS